MECSLEWLLLICHHRRTIEEYENSDILKGLIKKIEEADVIISPIADNRMYYIMTLFANGDINHEVALNSLAASDLGLQYVIKTDKALKHLKPLEKLYLSKKEKEESHQKLSERASFIDNKIKTAKRNYKDGKYIEEILL